MDHYNDYGAGSLTRERINLAMGRIRLIPGDRDVREPFHDFFCAAARFLLCAARLKRELEDGSYLKRSLGEMRDFQEELYRDMLPENYENSWLNPDFALRRLQAEDGGEPGSGLPSDGVRIPGLLCALYAELFSALPLIYAGREAAFAPLPELFLQIYGLFGGGRLPAARELRDAIYWYAFDYLDAMIPEHTAELLTPESRVSERLFHGLPAGDLRYLFLSGDYISEGTLRVASFWNALPEEKLRAAAGALTEGFCEGFRVLGKELSRKKTVSLRFRRGFERLAEREAELFGERGLSVILPGTAGRLAERIPGTSGRDSSLGPNRQFDYDHRFDAAIFWDKAFTDRSLSELSAAHEARRESAAVYAGPAVAECFGELPFSPLPKRSALSFTEKQRKLFRRYMAERAAVTERYLPGEESSFSIIAWPLPEIGPCFPGLFEEILRINTADNSFFRSVQQKMIDVLDRCRWVEVRGSGRNETSLRIALRELRDVERETRFENCAADVNIPAGELFTSPVLKGTEGLLHVSRVYVDGILFRDLRIRFEEGRALEFSCENFDSPEENRRFVLENIMGSREGLPMGEFAIGTNTWAWAAARRYGIEDRMPILIAEKTGPHFALGDTCYSHEEDVMTYNPDGKAIVARDNEISACRLDDPQSAYFNHHKDITLPYEELGALTAVMPDGTGIDLLRDGRFSLEGLEALNEALEGGQ